MIAPKQEYERQIKKATILIEYQRQRQIFDESLAIMQRTNNPYVLIRRYSELINFVEWVFEQKEKGLPLKTDKTKDQINEDIPAFFNFHAARIANYISEHTPKKNRHQSLMNLLSALKNCRNEEDAYIEISELINKNLTEK